MKESTFEDSMLELEDVVKKLEAGNLSLEESILEFEKGIKLSKQASQKLENAEKRINILLTDSEGKSKEEEFEPEE